MRSQIRSFLSITALVAASNSIAQNDLLPLEEAEAYSGITESRLIFRENCAVCHGENLEGATQGTPLREDLVHGESMDEIIASITDGMKLQACLLGEIFLRQWKLLGLLCTY